MGPTPSNNMCGGTQNRNNVTFHSKSTMSSFKHQSYNNKLDLSHLKMDFSDHKPLKFDASDMILDPIYSIPNLVSYNPNFISPNILSLNILSPDRPIVISTYHVSCASDKFNRYTNGVGIVVYRYDNKDKWELNNRRCRSGYIIYKHGYRLTGNGTSHSQVWKLVFGKGDMSKAVCGGFAFKNGKFQNRSGTFNSVNDLFHVGNDRISNDGNIVRELNELEFKWIKIAMINWGKGIQKTPVKSNENGKLYIHHNLKR